MSHVGLTRTLAPKLPSGSRSTKGQNIIITQFIPLLTPLEQQHIAINRLIDNLYRLFGKKAFKFNQNCLNPCGRHPCISISLIKELTLAFFRKLECF
jgi:hypothetical protein